MRIRSLCSIAVFAAVSLFMAASASASELKELARGVWAFVGENGATNSGFIVTGKGVVVIDTRRGRRRSRRNCARRYARPRKSLSSTL